MYLEKLNRAEECHRAELTAARNRFEEPDSSRRPSSANDFDKSDFARADSLRYNEQRNTIRQELAELRARESVAGVCAACCPIFTQGLGQ